VLIRFNVNFAEKASKLYWVINKILDYGRSW
jgi:hypothetical protein